MKALEVKATKRFYLVFSILGAVNMAAFGFVAFSDGAAGLGKVFMLAMAAWTAIVTIWAFRKFLMLAFSPTKKK